LKTTSFRQASDTIADERLYEFGIYVSFGHASDAIAYEPILPLNLTIQKLTETYATLIQNMGTS
jgi:hypothetical protein